MAKISLLLCVCVCMSALPGTCATGSEFSSQPYQASYETWGKEYSLVTRMTYDGKGNLKIETIQNHDTRTQVYLLNDDGTYVLREDKVALKLDMPGHPWDPFIRNWKQGPPAGLETLDAKEVCEHPSHGYRGKAPGIDGEVWIADDIAVPTMQKTNAPGGPMTLQLIDYKKLDPEQTVAIAIPSGYSVTTMESYIDQEKRKADQSDKTSSEVQAKFDKYGAYVQSMMGKQWHQTQGKYGKLDLSKRMVALAYFTINFDGSLSNVHIAESSGIAEYDRLVLDAIRTLPRLAPLPPGGLKSLESHFSFVLNPASHLAAKQPEGTAGAGDTGSSGGTGTSASTASSGSSTGTGNSGSMGRSESSGGTGSTGGSAGKGMTIPRSVSLPGLPIAVGIPGVAAITGIASLLSAVGSARKSKSAVTSDSPLSPSVNPAAKAEDPDKQSEPARDTKVETDAVKKTGRSVEIIGESHFPGKGSREQWEKAGQFHDEGADLLITERVQEAIEKIQAAILVYPDDYSFYNTLGVAYRHRGKPGDRLLAEEAFKRALSKRDDDPMVWECLGRLYEDEEKLSEAKNAYNKALHLNPSSSKTEELQGKIRRCESALKNVAGNKQSNE